MGILVVCVWPFSGVGAAFFLVVTIIQSIFEYKSEQTHKQHEFNRIKKQV